MESLSRRRALALGGSAALGTAGILAGSAVAGAAGTGTGTATAGSGSKAAGGWQRLVVVTANIGRKHRDQREAAIRAVRRAVTVGGDLADPLVGWQEIGEGDDDGKEERFIREHFGKSFRNLFVGDKVAHHVPMSVPDAFNVVDQRITHAHGGKKNVSPHRVVTEAVLELAADPQLRFVFANTHYVAGAFNGKNDPFEAWRHKMWDKHFRKHRDDVLAHWHGKGLPVIWTGDVNRSPMPRLAGGEKRAFSRGIDQIAWLPGSNGTEIKLKRTDTVPMHVDGHSARVAVMQIRRA